MSHPKPIRLKDEATLNKYRNVQCMICDRWQSEACHIRSRGAGGPDADFNLLALCHRHHQEQHTIGWIKMIERYPMLMLILMTKGWRLEQTIGLTRDHESISM